MSNQRNLNRVLLIVGIASFLYTTAAVFFGLPVWMVLIGVTMNAIIHMYYQPGERTDSSEVERLREELERIRQERQADSFGTEKVLRIREEYEKKIRSMEIENGNRIAELESALSKGPGDTQRIAELESALSKEEKNAQRIAELESALSKEKKNAQRIAELESALPKEEKNAQRIAELESALSKGEKNIQRIAELERDLAAEKEHCQRLKKVLEQSGNTPTYDASILPKLDPDTDKQVKVNVVEFFQKIARDFSKEAQEAGIDIRVVGQGGSIYVQAYEKMLLVLFRNIIDNALKYMNREGIMQITVTDLDDAIFIAIKDSGKGLSESETAHVFELNFQGSNRTSGNGLGLAQVKAIVEYYGGMVYAKSSSDKGMGIYIHLPAK